MKLSARRADYTVPLQESRKSGASEKVGTGINAMITSAMRWA